MEALAKILLGLCLLALALAYLYRPALVLKVNAMAREVLFNDNYILHFRRRWGLPLFVTSILFLYSGLANLSYREDRADNFDEMNQAYRAYYLKDYHRAILLCEEILARQPEDAHAQFLLRQADRARLVTDAPRAEAAHP